ncbi:metallophosphoesterase family protein [Halarsenatibacter silvermanii]|uniref:Phosphoesterase n=1 Tax=Halarsenatibacter silvermanii TaxID=321763 RepID=A0A1G9NH84_9FIRM|nr:metallophosphoesterase [Halarsenatibacter silvermanii]SDL85946.1 hypothetical protein SAMN04488692_11078 [Halarsenatibacter silvermanii]
MKLGVISDTHIPDRSPALSEKVREDFQNVDEIWHAGDITSDNLIKQLENIAPVKAVKGNCDGFSLGRELKSSLTLKRAGFKISLDHGDGLGRDKISKLSYRFDESDVIIFGHTHRAFKSWQKDQLFLNPGSPTVPRRQKYGSFALLEICANREIDVELRKIKG